MDSRRSEGGLAPKTSRTTTSTGVSGCDATASVTSGSPSNDRDRSVDRSVRAFRATALRTDADASRDSLCTINTDAWGLWVTSARICHLYIMGIAVEHGRSPFEHDICVAYLVNRTRTHGLLPIRATRRSAAPAE